MDPRLLQYYNLELQHLREMGAEFAQQFPKVAARLGMKLRIVRRQPAFRGVAIMPRHDWRATLTYPSSRIDGLSPGCAFVVRPSIAERKSIADDPANVVQALPIEGRKCASLAPSAASPYESRFRFRARADVTRPAGLAFHSSMPSKYIPSF